MCARRRTHLLLRRQKKVGQEKATPSLRPCASLRATCDARSWGGAAELAAFFELRSNSCGKPDHEVRVSYGTRTHPSPCASRRSQQGWGAGTTRLLLRSCAWGRLRAARCRRAAQPPWRAERSEGPQAERSNGPYGARSHPLLTVPRSAGPGVSACRRTRASLSDSPRLFERSSPAGGTQRVPRCTPGPSIAGCPTRPTGEWGHGQRGRLSLGYFSLAKQRTSTSAAGPRPGLRPRQKHAPTIDNSSDTQASHR